MKSNEAERRVRAILASGAVTTARPPAPRDASDPDLPWDLAALYAITDGVELADRTQLLGRAAAVKATAWLIDEKSLDWDAELIVLGERDDLVIVHDRDSARVREGGGVLEASTDALSSFRRVALDALGYLELRAGLDATSPIPPERAALEAAGRGDERALASAIARGFYPGAGRELAQAALRLGALRATRGDHDGALQAFAESAAARVGSVPRGSERAELGAAWRAAAVAAEKAGSPAIAEACRARAPR